MSLLDGVNSGYGGNFEYIILPPEFGLHDYLTALKAEADITYVDLSKLCGVSAAKISALCNNKIVSPKLFDVARIAHVFSHLVPYSRYNLDVLSNVTVSSSTKVSLDDLHWIKTVTKICKKVNTV